MGIYKSSNRLADVEAWHFRITIAVRHKGESSDADEQKLCENVMLKHLQV